MQKKPNTSPNKLRATFDQITSPLQKFIHMEASGGIFLLIMAVVAMVFANTNSLKDFYFSFINLPVSFGFAGMELNKTLLLLVNDGLMAIFFYLVGIEIKKEILAGELSTPKKASFSIFAAIGGMVFPALVYVGLNYNGAGLQGWGIPMATDIAFAIGVLTLLGKRVPLSLKVFLLALAIVDDLGAIMIIAIFYSGEISSTYLGFAAISLFLLFLLNYAGFRNVAWGIILGCITWFCFLKSGVHATIAGVLLAFLTPAYKLNVNNEGTSELLLDHYIHALHPWIAFFIMPVFAFFNAGVNIQGIDIGAMMVSPVTMGIMLGLLIGKPVGVLLMTFIAAKFKWADLPEGTNWGQIAAVGLIAGIGFTMSLFISGLAFTDSDLATNSKVGILFGSLIAMVLGYLSLLIASPKVKK